MLEATADGITDAALQIVYEARLRPKAQRSAALVDGQWAKIARALTLIPDRWASHLAGPLDAGQIALGCALGYLDFRLPDRNWRRDTPALAEWFASFNGRPAMQATQPCDPS